MNDITQVLQSFKRGDTSVAGDLMPLVHEVLGFFAGLDIDEAALVLVISRSTAKRHWDYARAWLYRTIREHR